MNNELEIMPVGMGVLVQPYAENPYLNDKTGILLSPDGDFINPDSGLKDKLEEHFDPVFFIKESIWKYPMVFFMKKKSFHIFSMQTISSKSPVFKKDKNLSFTRQRHSI